MAIKPVKLQQETSMGRKLLGMAAPIVGGIFGGPAGAAVGSAIGSKLTGGDSKDALMSGLGSFAQSSAATASTPGSSPLSRKFDNMSANPAQGINQGFSVLSTLPPDDPLRKELGPSFAKAQMMSRGR